MCICVCMSVWELEFSITVLLISLSQETAQAITLHLLDLVKKKNPCFLQKLRPVSL